ncbi:hypothetical protein STENM327S_07232 [Streptomyces tendae]
MDVRASLHVHGLDYKISSDGTAMNKSDVEPGGTRTYTWRTHKPGRRDDGTWRPGSAGYWHYHDHVVGTEHGTGGIRNGLYGPVIVRRKGDVLPDRHAHDRLQRHDHQQPQTAHRARLRGHRGRPRRDRHDHHGEYYHTFHMHGHRWADNRTGILAEPTTQAGSSTITGRRTPRLPDHRGGRGGRGGVDVPTATCRATPTWGWWACSW